jgi:tetratricopeptide (TPR) repeat protein
MRLLLVMLLCLFSDAAFGKACVEKAKEIEPQLPVQARQQYEAKLIDARINLASESSADNLIWLGRRTAYLGRYKEAIQILSTGVEAFPDDARFFRHRGHRYITIRCFDLAIDDLKRAAKLTKGKPDELEPDGLPNARNIPTSTLQSNIWYHLGLAYYLRGKFNDALKAYREAEKVSTNPDMLVATTHWLYMTLRRLGREQDASNALIAIKPDFEVIENADYLKLIRMYQGRLAPADLLKEISGNSNTLSNASVGYGLGNWYLYNRQKADSEKIFRQITSGNQWASFGFIAAETELPR